MMRTAIIGAGQLGSRHLQGVLRSSSNQRVYVVDPSQQSLASARLRAQEVKANGNVVYCQSIEELPGKIESVIIATNSNIRADLTTELLKKVQVDYLVLEKVLFPTIDAYDLIADRLRETNTKVWVNHARRMYPHFQRIQRVLDENVKTPRSYHVYGQNWGLGSNGLHFIDLFSYFEKSSLTDLDLSRLDARVIDSKRHGYKEFTGTISGTLTNGSTFTITSERVAEEQSKPVSIVCFSPTIRVFVQEGANFEVVTFSESNSFKSYIENGHQILQSDLSTTLINQLSTKGDCDLTPYADARINHQIFIQRFLGFYNEVTGQTSRECPIT